jgi:hypothetical protein
VSPVIDPDKKPSGRVGMGSRSKHHLTKQHIDEGLWLSSYNCIIGTKFNVISLIKFETESSYLEKRGDNHTQKLMQKLFS